MFLQHAKVRTQQERQVGDGDMVYTTFSSAAITAASRRTSSSHSLSLQDARIKLLAANHCKEIGDLPSEDIREKCERQGLCPGRLLATVRVYNVLCSGHQVGPGRRTR